MQSLANKSLQTFMILSNNKNSKTVSLEYKALTN